MVDLFDATKVAKAFLRVDTCREGKTSSPLLKAQVLGAYKLKTTIEEQKIEHRFFGFEEGTGRGLSEGEQSYLM